MEFETHFHLTLPGRPKMIVMAYGKMRENDFGHLSLSVLFDVEWAEGGKELAHGDLTSKEWGVVERRAEDALWEAWDAPVEQEAVEHD